MNGTSCLSHRITRFERPLAGGGSWRWKVFYALAYTSGARMAELFSLMWSDIDFENGRLMVANREGTSERPPFHAKLGD